MDTKQHLPSHPDKIKIIHQEGSFTSYAISQGTFAPGTLLARLTSSSFRRSSKPAYSSVQVGPNLEADHVELTCDFLFTNHSCDPNLEFRISRGVEKKSPSLTDSTQQFGAESSGCVDEVLSVQRGEELVIDVYVARRGSPSEQDVGLVPGEALSFFYPSTEWDMAQSFRCRCGTTRCKGVIRGAKYLTREELKGYFVNDHISELMEAQMVEREA